MMIIDKTSVNQNEYIPYFQRYFDLTPDGIDLITGLRESRDELISFYRDIIPKDKLSFAYDEGKWTIKEVLQHIIDTERIFMYRCFRTARHDTNDLSGFEQDDYILPSGANTKSLENLLEEYRTTRDAYISLLNSLSLENLAFIGSASGGPSSARGISFLAWGHQIWHLKIIKERYL